MSNRNRNIMMGGMVFAAIAIGYLVTRRRRKQTRPKRPSTARWHLVGTLKNTLIFPMKSGGYLEVDQADCTELGPSQVTSPGLFSLRDRHFIVFREDTKEMMQSMTYPIMVLIKIQPLSDKSVLFKCKDKPDLEIVIPNQSNSTDKTKAKMWTEELMGYLDCGDEAANWVTEVIKGDKNVENKLRLGYWAYPQSWKQGQEGQYNNRGAYQNYTSYMMMSNTSLADLENRLPDENLNFKQFRPNFLVDTFQDPFAEDNWTWVKIGENAEFFKVKDCSRCSQININPETSKFHSKQEPLKTLKQYRMKECGAVMGICLGLHKAGQVKVGDPVYVAM